MSPAQFQREGGTSLVRPRHSTTCSSSAIMAAEDSLLNRANDLSAPVAQRPGMRNHENVRANAACMGGGGVATRSSSA